MSEFITSIVLFCVFFIPLRLMRDAWFQGKLGGGFRWLAGVMAWGALLTSPAPLVVLILKIAEAFSRVSMDVMFTVGSHLFLASVVGYLLTSHPELIDYAGMKEFWYRSLHFQNPAARRDDIFHEAEWHDIKRTHAEQTGKPLVRDQEQKAKRPHTDPRQALRDLERDRSEPARHGNLDEDLKRLNAGEPVDVTDAFRLNTFRRKANDRYDDVQSLVIDPAQGLLKCRIVFPSLGAIQKADADGRFRILQEVYEVLHALDAELWLRHYEAYFATCAAECYRVETDSFDMPTHVPFLRVHCPVTELRTSVDKVYIVTELTRLRRAEWIG